MMKIIVINFVDRVGYLFRVAYVALVREVAHSARKVAYAYTK